MAYRLLVGRARPRPALDCFPGRAADQQARRRLRGPPPRPNLLPPDDPKLPNPPARYRDFGAFRPARRPRPARSGQPPGRAPARRPPGPDGPATGTPAPVAPPADLPRLAGARPRPDRPGRRSPRRSPGRPVVRARARAAG